MGFDHSECEMVRPYPGISAPLVCASGQSKPPFGGPQRVLEYLGRYTHRVALDNRRILNVSGDTVTFQYKQYRSADAHKSRTMTVDADEFIRRFLLHALPPGLARIRHYGLFAGRTKNGISPYVGSFSPFPPTACSLRLRRFRKCSRKSEASPTGVRPVSSAS